MSLSRIVGRTYIMVLHSIFVPGVAYLLNGNWPTEVTAEPMTADWAMQSALSLVARVLPHGCIDQPLVDGTNTIWRHLALGGWWFVGYLVLFIGFGHIIRQLPEYWRAMVKNLRLSAAALAAREAQ
jgi:hypothetical protein